MDVFWKNTDKIVVAVSGGVDSVVLLHKLVQHVSNHQLIVAHVNHFMRENALSDQKFVKQLAQQYGVVYETNDRAPILKSEEHARTFRYDFLKEIVKKYKASYVVTAHHQDDYVETVLLHLIRGNGLKSITGIPKKRVFEGNCVLYRPLLEYTKAQLCDYAKQHQLLFVEDETNELLHFTRNRLRNTILPLLRAENGQFDQHIVDFSKQLTALLQQTIVPKIEKELNITLFLTHDEYTQRAMLADWLRENGVLKKIHVESILQLMQQSTGQKSLDLGNHKRYVQTYHTATIVEIPSTPQPVLSPIYFEKQGQTKQWVIRVNQESGVPITQNQLPLVIRGVVSGDKIKISNGHKKVSRVLMDAKVPKNERGNVLVLATKTHEILAILDKRFDYLYKSLETVKIDDENQQLFVKIERIRTHDS